MPGEEQASGGAQDGQRFGRYTLIRKLATGGMGEVFLAKMQGAGGFEKLLVIKKMRAELDGDASLVGRFQDEAQVLVQMEHPAIAQVYDMGEVDGAPFMALEFVNGKDLKSVLDRCRQKGIRIPTAIALHVVIRVLDALAYAHRRKDSSGRELNLVHRDISPPNVLISYQGEVKVIDFGLAKTAASLQRTEAGSLVGKLFYMAPEAARHQPLDRRADLFAAGVVLHEILSGKHEFEGLSPGEAILRAVKPSYPRLAGVVPGVGAVLDAAIQKALSPDSALRFATAEQMRAPLVAALEALLPGFEVQAVAHFIQSLFAEEYAEQPAGGDARAGSGTILARPLGSPEDGPPPSGSEPTHLAMKAHAEPEPDTFDSGEYVPDDDAGPFAPTPARPDTSPSAAVRPGSPRSNPRLENTVISSGPIAPRPVASEPLASPTAPTLRPQPDAPAEPVARGRPRARSLPPPVETPEPSRPDPAGEPTVGFVIKRPRTSPLAPPVDDESTDPFAQSATVEARLDELPQLRAKLSSAAPMEMARPRDAQPPRRSGGLILYVLAAVALVLALLLVGLALGHRHSGQNASHLGQAVGDRSTPSGQLHRSPREGQVQRAVRLI